MDEKHIFVSLGDSRVRQIGEIIGNKTCNRILDFLVAESGTVSDISRKLKIPLNTVDYNVKKLVGAGLIEKSSHWWSSKGKKMPVYKVSNRKIIISPKKVVANVFVWVAGLTGLAALTLRELMKPAKDVVLGVADEGVYFAEKLIDEPMRSVGGAGGWLVISEISPWTWFLFGAWFAVVLFFVLGFLKGGIGDEDR